MLCHHWCEKRHNLAKCGFLGFLSSARNHQAADPSFYCIRKTGSCFSSSFDDSAKTASSVSQALRLRHLSTSGKPTQIGTQPYLWPTSVETENNNKHTVVNIKRRYLVAVPTEPVPSGQSKNQIDCMNTDPLTGLS